MAITIYHNNRCSKSRCAIGLLQEADLEYAVHYYLDAPLSTTEIRELLRKLGIPAHDLIRKNEAIYKAQYKGRILSEDEWIQAMAAYPELIERPIVVNGDRAIIARPPEKLWDIL